MAFYVTEIFHSLQGETTRAGRPCVFVRFTGCDLRCVWCDTDYAFSGGTRMALEAILEAVAAHPARYVTLTGGEPLLQRELPALARALLSRGYEVAVETHGQKAWDALPPEVIKIVDVKAPGSGEVAREGDLVRLRTLGPRDELKFVIADEADFRWAEETIRRLDLEALGAPILFSPVFGKVDYEALAGWLLASGLEARLQIQLHKLIWGAQARGV